MKVLTAFERMILFNFLRFATLAAVCLLAFAGWSGYAAIRDQQPTTHITLKDVEAEIGHKQPAKKDASNLPPELTPDEKFEKLGLYESAKVMFDSKDNRAVLLGWVENLSDEDRKDFIANLNEISVAPNIDAPRINKFKELKLRKLAANPFGRYMDQTKKLAAGLFIIAMVGLIGLFSLVLVLLAIERNTRPAKPSTAEPTVNTAHQAA